MEVTVTISTDAARILYVASLSAVAAWSGEDLARLVDAVEELREVLAAVGEEPAAPASPLRRGTSTVPR
jgi:hypothetical protein